MELSDLEKEKVDRTKMEYKKDRIVALSFSLTLALILFLILRFNGYRIPLPPLPEQVLYMNAEMDLIPVELEESQPNTSNGGSQGGAGTPSNDPLTNKPNPQTAKIVTDNTSDVAVNSGNSKRTNTDDVTQNTATTIKKSNNPFGSGGGSDHGTGSGVFGNDKGAGNGRGNGNGMGEGNGNGTGERVRLNNLNISDIKSNQDCSIKMQLSINAEGTVVGVLVLPGTTTSNQTLINAITSAVKKQIRYSKRQNANIERVYYTVNVKAQ